MLTTVKFYLAAAIIAVVGLMYWRYDYVTDQNSKLKADLSDVKARLEQSESILIKERQNAAEVALRAHKFYEDKANDDKELDSLRTCVANKSCGVRVVKGACPKVPSSASIAGGNEATDSADRKQFEQDYFSLVESIKETKRRFNWMQSELIARSSPDYCQPKSP